jgi:hypothetical protein
MCLPVLLLAGCGPDKPAAKTKPVAVKSATPERTGPMNGAAATPPLTIPESHNLSSGTLVPVRLLSVVDSAEPNMGFAMGTVDADVKGTDGRLAIPADAQVAMLIRDAGKNSGISRLRLALYSIDLPGGNCVLTDGLKDAAQLFFTEDAGKGQTHISVHLGYDTRIDFKLDEPVHCK